MMEKARVLEGKSKNTRGEFKDAVRVMKQMEGGREEIRPEEEQMLEGPTDNGKEKTEILY